MGSRDWATELSLWHKVDSLKLGRTASTQVRAASPSSMLLQIARAAFFSDEVSLLTDLSACGYALIQNAVEAAKLRKLVIACRGTTICSPCVHLLQVFYRRFWSDIETWSISPIPVAYLQGDYVAPVTA